MFDKSALNNHITAHKNSVKKAKVSVINKLVRKCRKLEKLPTTPLNNKINHKVNRLTLQIAAVKKLNCLQVLKKAILFANDPNTVITNGNAPVKDVAEMLIFSTKTVQEIVESLKVKFNLNESNPNWKEYFETERKKKSKSKPNSKNMSLSNKDSNSSEMKDADRCEFEDNDFSCNNVDYEKSNNLHGNSKKKVNVKVSKDNLVNEKFVSKPDPFFTTKNGDNYMSTIYMENEDSANKNYQNLNKDNPFSNREYNDIENKYGEEKNHLYQYKNKTNYKDRNILKLKTSFVQGNEKVKTNKIIRYEDFEENSADKTESDAPEIHTNTRNNSQQNLHPSWQAKQKLKPVIQEFKGQKLIFDD